MRGIVSRKNTNKLNISNGRYDPKEFAHIKDYKLRAAAIQKPNKWVPIMVFEF